MLFTLNALNALNALKGLNPLTTLDTNLSPKYYTNEKIT